MKAKKTSKNYFTMTKIQRHKLLEQTVVACASLSYAWQWSPVQASHMHDNLPREGRPTLSSSWGVGGVVVRRTNRWRDWTELNTPMTADPPLMSTLQTPLSVLQWRARYGWAGATSTLFRGHNSCTSCLISFSWLLLRFDGYTGYERIFLSRRKVFFCKQTEGTSWWTRKCLWLRGAKKGVKSKRWECLFYRRTFPRDVITQRIVNFWGNIHG